MRGVALAVALTSVCVAGDQAVSIATAPLTTVPAHWVTPLRQSTVMIRNATSSKKDSCYDCSGVCVSADGKVMTAKHCKFGNEVVILFRELGEVPATRIYSSPEAEGPVMFQLSKAGKYPFVVVSARIPAVGDKVRYFGFPDCKSLDQSTEGTGFITGGGVLPGTSVRINTVSNAGQSGMSGGPLLNDRGELIGLLHGSARDKGTAMSAWISTTAIQKAFAAVNQGRKSQPAVTAMKTPRLIAFVQEADKCPPCGQFERDAKAGLLGVPAQNAVIVKYINGKWMECDDDKCKPTTLAAEFQAATKSTAMSTPTFWVEGTADFRSGYSNTADGRNLFCTWLGNIWRGLLSLTGSLVGVPSREVVAVPIREGGDPILGSESPTLEPVAEPPPREVVTEPDWGGITVNIIAKRGDIGLVKGTGLKILLDRGIGPAERTINELLGGKATVRIIPERTMPNKYKAVCTVAGIVPDPIYVLVTVGEKDLGLKGIIVKKVEDAIAEHVPDGVPIDVIFKRVHEGYAVITQTLAASESMAKEASMPAVPVEPDPGTADKSVAPLGESEPSLPAKVAALMTSLLAGGGVTWGLRDWLRRRAESKLHGLVNLLSGRAEETTQPIVTERPVNMSPGASVADLQPQIVHVAMADPDVGLYHKAMAMTAKSHQYGAEVVEIIHSAVKQLRAQVKP